MNDSRTGEALSALIATAVSVSTFTSPSNAPVRVMMGQFHALPEWALVNLFCALVTIFACIYNNARLASAARFVSGMLWGTMIYIYGSFQQWLPLFWIAVAMFIFDIYLVAIKGQAWTRSNS